MDALVASEAPAAKSEPVLVDDRELQEKAEAILASQGKSIEDFEDAESLAIFYAEVTKQIVARRGPNVVRS